MKLARHHSGPEIFYSIQGEGPQQGAPSVFVRTSRCNLSCSWCDTPYTWNWRGTPFQHIADVQYDRNRETVQLSSSETVEHILKFPCQRVIFTGGEPLLQQGELLEVMRLLRRRDSTFVFEVETNGTLVPSPPLNDFVGLYAVSPKLSNCNVRRSLRLQDKALTFFANSPISFFKFVVDSAPDLEEILHLVGQYKLAASRVFLMPLGTTSKQLDERSPPVIEACQAHGFRFCDRLHIRLFGSKPGI